MAAAIFGRGDTDDAAEDTVEAALRHESAFEGDFGDRLFGITKKSAGFIYPERVQKFWKAHLHHLRHQPRDLTPAEPDRRRELLHRKLGVEDIFSAVSHDPLYAVDAGRFDRP